VRTGGSFATLPPVVAYVGRASDNVLNGEKALLKARLIFNEYRFATKHVIV
jgi:hypothetical protein